MMVAVYPLTPPRVLVVVWTSRTLGTGYVVPNYRVAISIATRAIQKRLWL